MPYQKDIRILRGSQRFKGSLDKNITIPTSLEQTHRMLIETERNAVLNLNEQYYRERDEKLRNDLIQKILVSSETGSSIMIPDSEDANNYHTCNSDHNHDDEGSHW